MSLKPVTPEQSHAFRDLLEERLQEPVDLGFKKYLNRSRSAAREAVNSPLPNVLLAAGGNQEMPTLGNLAQWWAQEVDESIMVAVRNAYIAGLKQWTDQGIDLDSPALLASRDYLAQVRSRLVLGTHMGVTVYEDSFNRIRASLAQSAAQGWTRQELAQRIATELSWEDRGPYWRSELAKIDGKMDNILDTLGEPGTPAREHARLHDPTINSLRADRNYVIKHMDAEKSVWQTRSTLIARTEATGAANYGGMQAFIMEGVATKVWLASGGPRTRLTHSGASGQEVDVLKPFLVGGALMQYPGDPAGPVQEVANCRCTMIGGEPAKSTTADTRPEDFPETFSDAGKLRSEYTALERLRPGGKFAPSSAPLEYYKGYGYSAVNGSLRGADASTLVDSTGKKVALSKIQSTIRAMDAEVKKGAALQADTTLLRGVHDLNPDDFIKDDFMVDAGFGSTTLDPSIANQFAAKVPGQAVDWSVKGQGDGWVMEIFAPKGTRGIVSGNKSGAEYEFILGRNTKFKVRGIDRANRKIWMEIVP